MIERDPLVGTILLGKLEVIRKIGGGGMGVVYEVEHRLTGHRRALKVVHAKFADRPRFMKRLLREAKVAGTLRTPYVVETFDAGRLEDGSAYVLMELLEGRSLYEAVQQDGRIAPRRLAEIMAQLAEGMSVAHAAGIVHRDLKPENVFLVAAEEGERVKILDFGVSKFEVFDGEAPTRLTLDGTLVGTPYYMSPEQSAGRTVDARTDVYAMGVMMYEALAGRLPFEAESVSALFVKIRAGAAVPLRVRRPDLDGAWCAVVHKALDRDPDQRFESAESLRRELVKLLGGGAVAARAKTISDGARATIGYSDELPPPPRNPSEAEPSEQAPASPSADAEPPQAHPSGRPTAPRGIPGWLWAAGGALAVLAVGVPLWLSRDGRPDPTTLVPSIGEPVIDEPGIDEPGIGERRLDARPAAPAEPSSRTAVDAGVAPQAEPPPRTRPRSTTTGLDPNPYRRR